MNVADDALQYQGRKFRRKITKFLPNPQLLRLLFLNFIRPFLAKAIIKQACHCSFGLSKWFLIPRF